MALAVGNHDQASPVMYVLATQTSDGFTNCFDVDIEDVLYNRYVKLNILARKEHDNTIDFQVITATIDVTSSSESSLLSLDLLVTQAQQIPGFILQQAMATNEIFSVTRELGIFSILGKYYELQTDAIDGTRVIETYGTDLRAFIISTNSEYRPGSFSDIS